MDKHFVSTTYIYNYSFTKTLLLWHSKLKSWLPPGGHIEENEEPLETAKREIEEETGIKEIDFIVPKNFKEMKIIVPEIILQPHFIILEDIQQDHFHMDMIFFARLNQTIENRIFPSPEGSLLKWFSQDEVKIEDQMFENAKQMLLYGFTLKSLV